MIILFPFFVFSFLALPLMCGYVAKSYGYSFWKWFALGCMLPVAANFILFLLTPVKSVNQRV